MKFPELSEQGNQDALHVIERAKSKLQKVAEEAISEIYVNILPHIETDSWINYREECRLALQTKYLNKETASSEDAWAMYIREAIFVQFRSELEQGIIADLQKRIKLLEQQILDMRSKKPLIAAMVPRL